MSDKKSLSLHFGAICQPLREQLKEQGFYLPNVEDTEKLAWSITALHLSDLITDAVARKARQKLLKQIVKSVKPIK